MKIGGFGSTLQNEKLIINKLSDYTFCENAITIFLVSVIVIALST